MASASVAAACSYHRRPRPDPHLRVERPSCSWRPSGRRRPIRTTGRPDPILGYVQQTQVCTWSRCGRRWRPVCTTGGPRRDPRLRVERLGCSWRPAGQAAACSYQWRASTGSSSLSKTPRLFMASVCRRRPVLYQRAARLGPRLRLADLGCTWRRCGRRCDDGCACWRRLRWRTRWTRRLPSGRSWQRPRCCDRN